VAGGAGGDAFGVEDGELLRLAEVFPAAVRGLLLSGVRLPGKRLTLQGVLCEGTAGMASTVILAKARIPLPFAVLIRGREIPAFAGMTGEGGYETRFISALIAAAPASTLPSFLSRSSAAPRCCCSIAARGVATPGRTAGCPGGPRP